MKKHSRGLVWVTGLKLKSHPVTKCSSGPQPYSYFSLREMTSLPQRADQVFHVYTRQTFKGRADEWFSDAF